jgi:hypothetical protein
LITFQIRNWKQKKKKKKRALERGQWRDGGKIDPEVGGDMFLRNVG